MVSGGRMKGTKAMDKIQEILGKFNMAQSSEFDEKAFVQFKADCENKKEGNLNEVDGYECPICKNKGIIYKIEEYRGSYKEVVGDCKCKPIRNSIMRMKRSGLEDVIKKYAFEKFEATEPWQEAVKNKAMEYAKDHQGWFFIGGQSGCGKTHICTAICRSLLLDGNEVYYVKWRDDISKLKAMAMDAEEREKAMDKIKNTKVLYIDDLFKTGQNPDGTAPRPTSADINLAFEIINHRYVTNKITVITSECTTSELVDIDQALAGRIVEKSEPYCVSLKGRDKDWRLKGGITL
jgi:DNA replication protein DnaC